MKARGQNTISITNKLLAIMLLIVLIQGVVYCAALVMNGGFDYLKKSAVSDLSSTTKARRNELEQFMGNRAAFLSQYQEIIHAQIQEKLDALGRKSSDLETDKELNREIMTEVSDELIDILRFNYTTEVYLVLDGHGNKGKSGQYEGMLIRNQSRGQAANQRGFLLEVGPADVSKHLGIALDSYWTSRFKMDDGGMDTDFYQRPVNAVRDNPDCDPLNMGYWSDFYRWTPDDIQVMSYSLPLAQDGKVYGVLGITLSENYMESMMPVLELGSRNTGAYILARMSGKNEYTPVYTSGVAVMKFNGKGNKILLDKEASSQSVNLLNCQEKIYGNIQNMEVYDKLSPFSDTKWALIGALPESTLMSSSNKLRYSIVTAFLLAAALGVVGAIVGSRKFTKPVTDMVHVIQSKDASERLEFEVSGIKEIDDLGSAVRELSDNVRDNASKVSQIIEMVGLPVGVIEYRRDARGVFCTRKIIDMLDLDEGKYRNGFLDKDYFEEFLERTNLKNLLGSSVDLEYQIELRGESCWLHVRSLPDDNKTLIAMTDVTEDVYERQKIEYERDYDVLTNLLSRRAFVGRIKEILKGDSYSKPNLGAMIMWDLDNLKYVNDTYGHDYGDLYIKAAARIFGSLSREGAVVGRLSGDEFVAFFPDCRTKARLLNTVERIKGQLNGARLNMPDNDRIAVRASGGIAWYPDDGTTFEELLKYADFAMYATKSSYKGEYKEFDKKVYEKEAFLLEGKERLNKLIEKTLVRYAFQPIVCTSDGTVFGYEALMRPVMEGLSSPSDVMRLATAQSRLPDIEMLTFTQALKEFGKLEKEIAGEFKLFVNSIPNQLISKELLMELMDVNEIDASSVVVEMIENEQSNSGIMERKLGIMKELGIPIAVDDFGSGYNSEYALLYIQPSYVKLDMSLVRGIDSDNDRQALVASMIHYASSRQIKVIAEGVETQGEMKTLIHMGVDYLQGYYLCRPQFELRDIREDVRGEIEAYGKEVKKQC